MKEGLNQEFKITSEQNNIQYENAKSLENSLKERFTILLKESPIKVYTEYGDSTKAQDTSISFNSIEKVYSDNTGSGGSNGIQFHSDAWMGVGRKGFSGSIHFSPKHEYYKFTNDAFHKLLTFMKETIDASGYSDIEKEKMFKDVVDSLKNKVIREENITEAK